jgi:hypothetical protein
MLKVQKLMTTAALVFVLGGAGLAQTTDATAPDTTSQQQLHQEKKAAKAQKKADKAENKALKTKQQKKADKAQRKADRQAAKASSSQ